MTWICRQLKIREYHERVDARLAEVNKQVKATESETERVLTEMDTQVQHIDTILRDIRAKHGIDK